MFSMLACCGALQGEEVPSMDLDAMKEFTGSGLHHPKEDLKHGVVWLHCMGDSRTQLAKNVI
jgi:hypothetical protein